jgi:hypothetical protein
MNPAQRVVPVFLVLHREAFLKTRPDRAECLLRIALLHVRGRCKDDPI